MKLYAKVIIAVVLLLVIGFGIGIAVNRIQRPSPEQLIFSTSQFPEIIFTDNIDVGRAKALHNGYSWFDGRKEYVYDTIPTWQWHYTEENTLVLDGEMGQNRIALSSDNPIIEDADLTDGVDIDWLPRYVIYLPDGTVFDNGTRALHDSLSPRLYYSKDFSEIGVIASFEPGEYIYEVVIRFELNDIPVAVTYGFKLITTGKRNAYDESLSVVWNEYSNALSVTYTGRETLYDERFGECYCFDVELQTGIAKVAISKEHGTLAAFGSFS